MAFDPYNYFGTRRGTQAVNPNPYPMADQTEAQAGPTGSTTPASVQNANTQPPRAGSTNVFTDVLDHVNNFTSAISGATPFTAGAYGMPGGAPGPTANRINPQSTGGATGSYMPPVPPAYGGTPIQGPQPIGGVPNFATPVPSTPVYDPATGLWALAQSGTTAQGTAPVAGAPGTAPVPQQPGGELPPSRGATGPAPTPVPSDTSVPTWDPATGQWLYAKSYSNEGPGGNGPGDGPVNRLPDGGDNPNAPPPNTPPPNTPPPNTPPPNTQPPGGGRGHRPADPVTSHNDWLHFDSTGKPWGNDNLPPNPGGTEDPAVAARWYSQFNFLDPSLVNVTAADVQAFRTSGYNPTEAELSTQPGMLRSAFLAWWQHGKPTPAQNPPPAVTTPPPGGPTNPNGWVDPSLGAPPQQRRTPPPSAAPQAAPAPPAGTTPPPGGTAPPPATTPPPDAGTAPPASTTVPPSSTEEITKLIDLFNSGKGPQAPPIEDTLNPMFARQRQNLADQMRADAASTGALHSGGFGQNLGNALSNLSGQQSAALASELGQEYTAKLQQNTQLTQLATQAGMQKYIADVNTDLERFKVNSNDDLQRWLNDKNNTLAKYGIDKNDVLQRYQAELQLKGVQYSADRSVDAAALHAAAAQAAAAASSAAAQYGANVQLQLGMGNMQVQRENNIGNFILGLLGLGQAGIGDIGNIFNQFPSGGFFVKP